MFFNRNRRQRRKGIRVFILRAGLPDLSNNGISARHDAAVLTGPDIPQLVSPSEEAPEIRLIRNQNPEPAPQFAAAPATQPRGTTGPSRGGCFVFSQEQGFPAAQPIPLLDRFDE